MKKYLSLVLLFCLIILFCSCSIGCDGTEPTVITELVVENSSSQDETITEQEPMVSECLITVPNSTVPDEDAVITTTLEYDISPISSYTFEEVVDVFLEKAGIDDYTLGDKYQGESEYSPIYYPDYSVVIEGNRLDVYYVPYDYELHRTRSFGITDLNISVTEYDDPEWAEIGFWGNYQYFNTTLEFFDCINDDITNGYCFINDSDNSVFRASYYLNDCVLVYKYNIHSTPEEYQIYLDICEELGLPTCDEVTEEILG